MRALVLLTASLAACSVLALPARAATPESEVVVRLSAPPLARAIATSRVLTDTARARRLDLQSPTSRAYLAELAALQRQVAERITAAVPTARVFRRFRIVVDGLAIIAPAEALGRLAAIPGVAAVERSGAYGPTLNESPDVIGAPALWDLPSLSTAGTGMKIGIIDMGIDPRLSFFDPSGYSYPPGFPKGDRTWTTPKVIVARGFAPPNVTWKYARSPYDPLNSDHGDHVAGIAAGNHGTPAIDGRVLSGVAPRAYLGNYKVFATPTPEFGLVENSTEVIAAIEAAVRDGMDVINLSLGEYEVNPARNLVDAAIDAAADAGVVPVSAAGNSFEEVGRGSIGSPATAANGIAVAAVTNGGRLASWSSRGPTPLSLRLKPDVSAPGVSILSSVPDREGTWASFSGTSMAAPHVAGGAALLLERHPDWTVGQVKSALVLTGRPVISDSGPSEAPANAQGGGLISLPAANDPLVFASPSSLAFGLVRAGTAKTLHVDMTDAGGGAGSWSVSVKILGAAGGVTVTAPSTITVPGGLDLSLRAASDATEADVTGYVFIARGALTRRMPFWTRVERPRLGTPVRTLTRAGRYSGNTRHGHARVTSYRYPDDPRGVGVSNDLPGPEQVFRVRVGLPVANLGVRIVGQAKGVVVTPRIVASGDENQLAGVSALPLDINPYRDSYGAARSVSAALVPSRGFYDVVFDTRSRAVAGPFSFRLWLDDTTPPHSKLQTKSVPRDGDLLLTVVDGGSGVDARSLRAFVDGRQLTTRFSSGKARVLLSGQFNRGRHTLVFEASDYQELKNSEITAGYLPNTSTLRTSFTVR